MKLFPRNLMCYLRHTTKKSFLVNFESLKVSLFTVSTSSGNHHLTGFRNAFFSKRVVNNTGMTHAPWHDLYLGFVRSLPVHNILVNIPLFVARGRIRVSPCRQRGPLVPLRSVLSLLGTIPSIRSRSPPVVRGYKTLDDLASQVPQTSSYPLSLLDSRLPILPNQRKFPRLGTQF